MTSLRPFPYAALPAYSRADVAAGARLRRVMRGLVRLEALDAAAAEVLGAHCHIVLGDIRRADRQRGADDFVGVMIAHAGDRVPSRRVLVEAPAALVADVVARAVRHKTPKVIDPSRPLQPAAAGAFAAVLATIARRAHADVPLQIVAAGPGAVLARDLVASAGEVSTASLRVTLDGELFEARVSVPDDAATLAAASLANRDPSELARLGEMPIALPVVIAETLASRVTLAALAPGDAFLPFPPGSDALRLGEASTLEGPVVLLAARSEVGIGADLAPSGRLVVRGRSESHPWDRGTKMDRTSSSGNTNPTLQAVDDAPVVVRVELGVVEMTARAWSELGVGDVVALDKRIGEPAILRVGGVEVARGELVQIEGEIGVKIVSRSDGNGG